MLPVNASGNKLVLADTHWHAVNQLCTGCRLETLVSAKSALHSAAGNMARLQKSDTW